MSKALARLSLYARWPLLWVICLNGAYSDPAVQHPKHPPHATRQDLIGVWRLQSIQVVGPKGPQDDPFYNANSTGILVYDPSGWMSVQIVGQPRPAMEVPASRPARTNTADEAQLKAAVLDTYYAYFGTWEYDESTSTVSHHIQSSLIPSEDGMTYSQTATLEGGELIFSVRKEAAGGTAQKKVWKRILGP
jgi:hypothetical protein